MDSGPSAGAGEPKSGTGGAGLGKQAKKNAYNREKMKIKRLKDKLAIAQRTNTLLTDQLTTGSAVRNLRDNATGTVTGQVFSKVLDFVLTDKKSIGAPKAERKAPAKK